MAGVGVPRLKGVGTGCACEAAHTGVWRREGSAWKEPEGGRISEDPLGDRCQLRSFGHPEGSVVTRKLSFESGMCVEVGEGSAGTRSTGGAF